MNASDLKFTLQAPSHRKWSRWAMLELLTVFTNHLYDSKRQWQKPIPDSHQSAAGNGLYEDDKLCIIKMRVSRFPLKSSLYHIGLGPQESSSLRNFVTRICFDLTKLTSRMRHELKLFCILIALFSR